jgi:serine/threonine protein phosphatase PrpC
MMANAFVNVDLNPWCTLQDPLVGLLTGKPMPDLGRPPRTIPRSQQELCLENVLLDGPCLPLGCVCKVWAGLLLLLDRIHHSRPDQVRLLLFANLRQWWLLLPRGVNTLLKSEQGIGLAAYRHARTLDDLPGSVRFRPDLDLQLHLAGLPLPELLGVDRFQAPEVQPGAAVGPSADVYLAASLALAMLTNGPVHLSGADVPPVSSALRLFRGEMPPRVQLVLETCLVWDPAGRTATPREACDHLRTAVQEDLASLQRPARPFHLTSSHALDIGPGKAAAQARGEAGIPGTREDEILCAGAERLQLFALFDGVSRTDVGTGAQAARWAASALADSLAVASRKLPAEDSAPPIVLRWLHRTANRCLGKAHRGVIRGVMEELADELQPHLRTPQTTCVVALMLDDLAMIGYAGDSPAWLVSAGGAVRLTAPLTVSNLTLRRERSLKAAREVSSGGALGASLGGMMIHDDDTVEYLEEPLAEFTPVRLDDQSLLVLCSDGVSDYWGMQEQERLAFLHATVARILAEEPRTDRAAQLVRDALWAEALRRESRDDMALIVVAGSFTPPAPEKAEVTETPREEDVKSTGSERIS